MSDVQSLAYQPPLSLETDGRYRIFLERPWIEIEVLSAAGVPAANVAYELTLPSGDVLTGRSDADGLIRHDKLNQEGECELRFPEIDGD